jgi:hypothetical protein
MTGLFGQMGPAGMDPMFGGPQPPAQAQAPAPAAQPQGFGDRMMGILGGLGTGIQSFLDDDEKRARLAIALNSMRLNPDPSLARAMQSQMETAQATRLLKSQGNVTAETIRKMGGRNAEAYASAVEKNPSLAKEYFAAFLKERGTATTSQMTGEQLNADSGVTQYDPTAVYNVKTNPSDPSDRSITKVGGSAPTFNFGAGEATVKAVEGQLGGYVDRGTAARRQNSQLMFINQALSGVQTGAFEDTKATVRSFAARLGVPVDESQLASAETIRALTAQLVAEELRQNKGPQTDFDQKYAESYMISLGKESESNQRILDYMHSRNLLDSVIGSLAAQRTYEFDQQVAGNDVDLARELNTAATRLGSVIEKDDKFITFGEFYGEARKSMTDRDILKEWAKLHGYN